MSLLQRTAALSLSGERLEHLTFSPLALSQPNMHRASSLTQQNRPWWKSVEDEVSVGQPVSVQTQHFATGDVRRWDGFVHKGLKEGSGGTAFKTVA